MPREHRTHAIVLRSFDQGESDRLIHLYTRDLGRVAAIAKGARRSRRRFPGALELFSLLEVRLVAPRRSSLMRLEAARIYRPLEGLAEDLLRFAIACLFVELLDRLCGEGERNPELFDFATGVLEVVASESPDRLLAVLVLAKTCSRLGYRPQLMSCAACAAELAGESAGWSARQGGALCARCAPPEGIPVAVEWLAALERGLRTPLRERAVLGLDTDAVLRAERLLGDLFRFHVGLELRSAAFLRSVLEGSAARVARRVDAAQGPGNTPPPRAMSSPLP